MKTKVYAEAQILKIPVQAALEVDSSNSTTRFVVDGNGDSTTTFTLAELVDQLNSYNQAATATDAATIKSNLPLDGTLLDNLSFNLDKVFIAGKYSGTDIEGTGTKFGFKISVSLTGDESGQASGFFQFKHFSFVVYSDNLANHTDILDKLNISEVNRLLNTYAA